MHERLAQSTESSLDVVSAPEARLPRGRMPAFLAQAAGLLSLCLVCALPAAADTAWISSEVRLNVRTGAGTNFRILATIVSGDAVEVLARQENWTQVKLADGRQGWIPAGYLKDEAPPSVRLEEAEKELEKLRADFESTSSESIRLREANAEISSREKERSDEINRLTLENLDLRAGPRWPEWITGASILSIGMMLGALLRRSSSRRPTPRIRL